MNKELISDIRKVIISSVGGDLTEESLTTDYQLIGNVLDSMAVTNVILALEEYFGFTFDDEELSAESFDTLGSLTELVRKKIS